MTAPEWEVYLDGTREPKLVHAFVNDTANPFGSFAEAIIHDREETRFDAYSIFDPIEFVVYPDGLDDTLTVESDETVAIEGTESYSEINVAGDLLVGGDLNVTAPESTNVRFEGYVADIHEQEEQGTDKFVVEAHTYDQFLRGEKIDEDLTGSTIFEALETIVTGYTPVTWDPTNVEVGNNKTLTRGFRGEKVETALVELSFKSVSEEFGVNSDLEFFFRPLEDESAPGDLGTGDVIRVEVEEDGRAAPNQVTVWFNGGDESVTVSIGTDKFERQDAVGTDRPVTDAEELTREDITNVDDAIDIGERYLENRQGEFLGDVTARDLFDAEIGNVISVDAATYNIDDDYRIAALAYEDSFETIVSIVDQRREQDERLVNFGDTLDRVESRSADRDAISTEVTSTQAQTLFDITANVGGSAFTRSRITNTARNAIRDAWQQEANPIDITHIAVGDDASNLSRANTALENEIDRVAVSETLDGDFGVGYDGTFETEIDEDLTFSDTGESGQNVDVSGSNEVTVELWGPGGGDPGGVLPASGGKGGHIESTIDTSDIDTLEVFPGERGGQPGGGLGLYDGGEGADDPSAPDSGGGGASTSIRDGDGNELIHADGGGGGGVGFDGSVALGGGGGARGGDGGSASGGSVNNDGQDGEGIGNGGDGGDATADSGDDGGDGGTEVLDARVTEVSSTVGGGNDGDGRVVVTGEATDISEVGLFDANDDLICRSVNEGGSVDALTVESGETHTIEAGETETYTTANVEGTLEVAGTLGLVPDGVTMSITVQNDDTVPKGLLTNVGRESVRDILADNSPDLINYYGYGDDGAEPAPDDTAISEVYAHDIFNQQIQEADTTSEWNDILPDFADTDPFIVESGALTLAQTGFFFEAEDNGAGGISVSNSDFSGGAGRDLEDIAAGLSGSFTTEHTIPNDNITVGFRHEVISEEDLEWEIDIDGNTVDSGPVSFSPGLDWNTFSPSPVFGDLSAGSHTLNVSITTGTGEWHVDCFAIVDDRFGHTFDNSVHEPSGYLDGPELYPTTTQEATLSTASSPRNVSQATVDQTWNDHTQGNQFIELSNDDFSTSTQESNSDGFTAMFASQSSDVDTRVGMSAYPLASDGNAQDATPRFGYNGHAVQTHSLSGDVADLEPTGIGALNVIIAVPANEIDGETIREMAQLTDAKDTLTRSIVPAFTVEANQRIISRELTQF